MSNKINEVIFKKHYKGERTCVPFGDFPPNLLPTDTVTIDVHEAFYTENNSSDGVTWLIIKRERDKTPEEIAKDKEFWAKLKEKSKADRLKQFEKLKQEFEP